VLSSQTAARRASPRSWQRPSSIGIFKTTMHEWQLKRNITASNGCNTDSYGAGRSKIGVFRPTTGEWFLDLDGNGQWDGCGVDKCITSFGQEGDLPVAGKWYETNGSFILGGRNNNERLRARTYFFDIERLRRVESSCRRHRLHIS